MAGGVKLNERITTKIDREALRLLRLIAAVTNERIVHLLSRIIRDEYRRVRDKIPG